MNRIAVFIGLAVLAIGGYYAWQSAPIMPSGPPDVPRTFTGSGMLKTEAFHLRGGSYLVQWRAKITAANQPSCPYSIRLARANSGQLDVLVLTSVKRDSSDSGESTAHRVSPGDYYLDVVSACEWQATLAPHP